jgi:hypothetical protein
MARTSAFCKSPIGKSREKEFEAAYADALNLAFDTAAQEAISSTPAASVAPTTSANDAPNDDRLKSLIQRLDSALGADGRLI